MVGGDQRDDQRSPFLWGNSASDVWAVGAAGTVLRYTGGPWSSLSTQVTDAGASVDFSGVWGTGPSDMWIVGANSVPDGVIVHGNGATWTTSPDLIPYMLFAVNGAQGTVWAVGEYGEVLRHP